MNIEQERARLLGLLSGITPGEWRTDNDDGSSGFLFALNEEGVNRMAASVTRGRDDSGERASLEESHANSELMAAAPDLARKYADALAEIERLKAALRDAGPTPYKIARAALAAASAPEERP